MLKNLHNIQMCYILQSHLKLKVMREQHLLRYHKRAIHLLKLILELQQLNSDHRYFMESSCEITNDTLKWYNQRIDINNKKIDRIQKWYNEVKENINQLNK